MSIWHTVKDIDDVQISDDGTTFEILLNSDHNGDNYIEVPIEFIQQRLSEMNSLDGREEIQKSMSKRLSGH